MGYKMVDTTENKAVMIKGYSIRGIGYIIDDLVQSTERQLSPIFKLSQNDITIKAFSGNASAIVFIASSATGYVEIISGWFPLPHTFSVQSGKYARFVIRDTDAPTSDINNKEYNIVCVEGSTAPTEYIPPWRYRKIIDNNPLPSEYQEVEYIESTGTQYIDTGVLGKSDLQIMTKIQILDSISPQYLFGARDASIQKMFSVNVYNNYIDIHYNDTNHTFISVSENDILNININRNIFKCNNNTYTFNTATFINTYNMMIFRCSQLNQFYAKEKMFFFKTYDNGTLIRNFIPCYRKSDNVIGMYDKVNGAFYQNSGTGTFLKGNDVIHQETTNYHIGG